MAGLSPTAQTNPSGPADSRIGQSPLGIGPVLFLASETPPNLAIELQQVLAVHDYVGGGRVIQRMGPRASDIAWEGKIRGSNDYVDQRNRDMLGLAKTGQTVTMTWRTYAYDVIVGSWKPTWQHEFRLDYAMTVKVLRDQSGTYGPTKSGSVDTQTLALYNSGNAVLGSFGTLTLQPQQQTLLQQLQSGMAALGQALQKAGPLANAIATGNAVAILNILATLIPQAQAFAATLGTVEQQVVQAQTLIASLSLIQKTLQAGAPTSTIVVSGGTLYDVAARLFGNPSLASAIAQAQTPPLLTYRLPPGTPTTLVIPPLARMSKS